MEQKDNKLNIYSEEMDIDKLSDNQYAHNMFVEGDNLKSMKVLRDDYKGKIKLVYVDPPYNTGSEFIYDDESNDSLGGYNKYSDNKEKYYSSINDRHEKWKAMMSPRLMMAKEYLKEDGVIAVSIDDNEMFELRMLLNEIMGEGNFLGVLVWRRKNYNYEKKSGIETQHEYIVLYKKSNSYSDKYKKPISSWIDFSKDEYIKENNDSYELSCCYQDACKKDIDEIFGRDMNINYPKSVMQMKMLVDLFCSKNDIVMDLFAGSGTMEQAIIEYNVEHDEHITFIAFQLAKPTSKGGFTTISEIAWERCMLVIKKYYKNTKMMESIRRIRIES